MLRFLFGFKWRKSAAHLLLLSKFLKPHTIEDYKKTVMPWRQPLGEHPKKAIKRFLKEGMLNRGGLADSLAWRYRLPDLKRMLKERNLPISGNKSKLILRLIEADPNGMGAHASGLKVLVCSEEGCQIAEAYLTSERERRHEVEQRIVEALQKRRFKKASLICASFEARQVFPRPILSSHGDWRSPEANRKYWQHFNPAYDVEILDIMFSSKPKILKDLSVSRIEHLRLAAGMMYLWGTRDVKKDLLPPNLATGLPMNSMSAARMILFHARNQGHLAQYREWGCKSVEILTGNDVWTCEACKKIGDKKYKIDKVPELPYEKCTCDVGCRCSFDPVID
jgi:SAP domain